MELITLFGGNGFIGSRYYDLHENVIKMPRDDYNICSNNVLYLISTVDNYNVFSDPYVDIDTNLNCLIKTLESHKYLGNNITFNFVSSWFVYGDVELPAKENSVCDPKGFYSITKRAAEQLLISYCQTFGLKYRILRLGNVMGKDDKKASKKKNAIQYMINCLKNNEDISLYDDGESYRDYIYVDDCIAAIDLVLEKGNVNEIYNIGNGEPILLKNLMEKAKEKLNSSSQIKSVPTPEFHKIVQTKDMVLDISKIKDLGYQPKYNIDSMLDVLIR